MRQAGYDKEMLKKKPPLDLRLLLSPHIGHFHFKSFEYLVCGNRQLCSMSLMAEQRSRLSRFLSIYAYYKYSLHCEGCLFVIFHKKDYKDALELELHLSFKYNILFTGICKRSFGLQRDSRNNNFAVDNYEKVEV